MQSLISTNADRITTAMKFLQIFSCPTFFFGGGWSKKSYGASIFLWPNLFFLCIGSKNCFCWVGVIVFFVCVFEGVSHLEDFQKICSLVHIYRSFLNNFFLLIFFSFCYANKYPWKNFHELSEAISGK